MQYAIPKGVFDILPEEPQEEENWRSSDRWQYIESIMRETAHQYGFREIRTPVFERTELFVRGVGESSDIVSKEMYTFLDKAERSMSLRPEGTASVIRAFVEKNLHHSAVCHKFYYIASMFRYERPQAGRYRQHHQFGVEAIGNGKPEQDVEVIDLLCELYRRLGLKDLTVMLNTLGDAETYAAYKNALEKYLKPFFNDLSADSQNRFSKNILRILDSKAPEDKKVLEKAPSILDYLSEESGAHFSKVCALLNKLHIPYKIEPKMVRGLDYYNHTVFEVTSTHLGAQNSLGGGGRYNGLISSFGGPDLPAFGFGTGLERILQTMKAQKAFFPLSPHPFLFLVSLGEKADSFCFELLQHVRHEGISAEMDSSPKKVGQSLQRANALNADYVAIIGEEELTTGKVSLKEMRARTAQEVKLLDLPAKILELYRKTV